MPSCHVQLWLTPSTRRLSRTSTARFHLNPQARVKTHFSVAFPTAAVYCARIVGAYERDPVLFIVTVIFITELWLQIRRRWQRRFEKLLVALRWR
jgi:hypothetical protein